MKFYNSFKRSNGSIQTQEFSAEEMLNFQIFKLAMFLIVGSLFAVLVSPITLIFRLFNYDKDEKLPSLIGIVSSLYLMVDYSTNFIVITVLRVVEQGDEKVISTIMACNLVFLIAHVFVLIFGDTIYFNAKEKQKGLGNLLIYLSVCMVLSFVLATSIYNEKQYIASMSKKDIKNEIEYKKQLSEDKIVQDNKIKEDAEYQKLLNDVRAENNK